MTKKELSAYFAKIGAKGGQVKGESKRRGGSEYYRRIRKGLSGKKGGK